MKEITIGFEKHECSIIIREDKIGIRIIGTKEFSKDEIIIWVENLKAARYLQDLVNTVALTLNGYQDCFEEIGRLRDLSDNKSSSQPEDRGKGSNKMFYSDECHYLTYSDKTICNKCGKIHNKEFKNYWFMMKDIDSFKPYIETRNFEKENY